MRIQRSVAFAAVCAAVLFLLPLRAFTAYTIAIISAGTPDVLVSSPTLPGGPGTISTTNAEVSQTGATVAFTGSGNCASNSAPCNPNTTLEELTNSSGTTSVSLANPSTSGYGTGFTFRVIAVNAVASVAPTGGATINGASSLSIPAGQTASIWTNAAGTEYLASSSSSGSSTSSYVSATATQVNIAGLRPW